MPAPNPFRELCNFALKVHTEELERLARFAGRRREGRHEWGSRFQQQKAELTQLHNAALCSAELTAFGIEEVERRLNALVRAVTAILLWQRGAPSLTAAERQQLEASATWHDPAGDYLSERYQEMIEAWEPVNSLAVRVDDRLTEISHDDNIDVREVPLTAPQGTPSPLRETFEAVADALFQAADMRRKPPSSWIAFEAQANQLAEAMKLATTQYVGSELQFRAVANEGADCAVQLALDAVRRVNDSVGHVMLKVIPFEQATLHIQRIPPLNLRKLLVEMRRQTSMAALNISRTDETGATAAISDARAISYADLEEKLLEILDGDLPKRLRYQEEHDQAVCQAVCRLTKMTPAEWKDLRLPQQKRPWVEAAIERARAERAETTSARAAPAMTLRDLLEVKTAGYRPSSELSRIVFELNNPPDERPLKYVKISLWTGSSVFENGERTWPTSSRTTE
jgi:hypothetical protein